MAEYIEREEAIDACFYGWNNNAHDCAENIRAIPAADVRPVVFCRDCKHSTPWYSNKSRCFLWHEDGIDVFNDGFCNYGEKREES